MIMNDFLSENNLENLLNYLYPNSNWIKDKVIPKELVNKRLKENNMNESLGYRKFRPDYRNEELSIIVEFDGIHHYQDIDVFWNDIERETYYKDLGYKFIQIPYYVQPTKDIVKLYFGINVENDMTTKKNGFNLINDKPNKNLPASFSELGIRRFMVEFSKFEVETQTQILETLYDNYELKGMSLLVLPASLIKFLDFKITEYDEEYNSHFQIQ